MPDLNFRVERAEPLLHAAAPTMRFTLRASETVGAGVEYTPIHSVILRCQIRIEPARRSYLPAEKRRLRDLFGTPERWGQTLRPMLWTHVVAVIRPFVGETDAELPVPCGSDFEQPATRYFAALDGGDLPLCFLFSGTIFYEGDGGALRVAQIPWDREAEFRLPAATWNALMKHYHANTAWLTLRKDVFDQLVSFRDRHGLPTWEQTLERLLAPHEEPVSS
jgi:hypothetical protein